MNVVMYEKEIPKQYTDTKMEPDTELILKATGFSREIEWLRKRINLVINPEPHPHTAEPIQDEVR